MLSRRNDTNLSLVGEMRVGKMRVGEMSLNRIVFPDAQYHSRLRIQLDILLSNVPKVHGSY